MDLRIGFIGIGNMGQAMALRLLEIGHPLRVHDIDAGRVANAVREGAVAVATPAALGSVCNCVIVAVVDAAQTDSVLFGADGIAATLPAGACVMLCPTLGPASVEDFAARLAARAIDCIDAPMSGGPVRARDGSMSLMVACADPVFARHAALLSALSAHVFRIGERVGDGARTKLVNNLLAAVNLAGAAEALALAERLGLDAARMQRVIERSSGQSWIGADRMPRALAGDLAPRAHTTLLHKDSALAIAMAEAAGFDAALGRQAAGVFEAACAAGFGALDDASLLPYLRLGGSGDARESPAADAMPSAAATLDAQTASAYAGCALASLNRRYPFALQRLMRHADDRPRPEEVHPIFHGSYDWHSSVHMHWSLARLLRLQPGLPQRATIVAHFERGFRADCAERERAHLLAEPRFERPYGWAWLMLLQTELDALASALPEARAWGAALEPLIELLRRRWLDFLVLAGHPQRAGVHSNSAFAMTLAHVHAQARGDGAFADALESAARRWFGGDTDYPARYEPSANDFLSGGLCEAVLMTRVLGADFGRWWSAFSPCPESVRMHWLRPVVPASRIDAQLVHLDGLNLSRSWCLEVLGAALPAERGRFSAAREAHLAAALPHVVEGDFVATHWLVSFAVLARCGLTLGSPGAGPGPAPAQAGAVAV